MAARLKLTLAAALLLVAFALAGVLLLGGDDGAGAQKPFTVGPSGFAGAVSPPGALAPEFHLHDEHGAPLDLAAERGHVTVVTFLYTTCQDTCPIVASQVGGALDRLGDAGKDVAALAISVDPGNDTPALARKFLLDRRMTGRMHFALGDAVQLRPVWRAWGVLPQGQDPNDPDFDHTTRVEVLDRHGFRRVAFPYDQLTPEALAHDIQRLQAE